MKGCLKIGGYIFLGFVVLSVIGVLLRDKNDNIQQFRAVNTQVLNVRKGPGADYNKVGEKEKGQKLAVLKDTSGWLKVKNNDTVAWVKKDFTLEASKYEKLQQQRERATNSSSQSEKEQQAQSEQRTKSDLELINHDFKEDKFNSYIVGRIKNNTSQTYSYVQVQINLYNENGTQIGSTMDNINGLEPNRKWKFKAPIVGNKEVAKYKIREITKY